MNCRKPAAGPPVEAEKTSETREKILATALTLFTRRGFFGTPTSLISKEAGVATGTLFFHFPTKDDLIDTLYRRIKSEAAQAICLGIGDEENVQEKLRRLGYNFVEWGIQNSEKLTFIVQFAHSPFISTSTREEGMSHFLPLREIVRDGIREGTIRDIDPDLLFRMMGSTLFSLIERVSAVEDPDGRKKITEEGLEFIFRGMMV
jgi:AcrR family transcriptional regulator